MKLKGERAINRSLNSWLRKYGFTARVAQMDTDFYWYTESNTIGYSLFQTVHSQEEWDNLLTELNLRYEVDSFWTCFLHELGHSMTWGSFTEEEIEENYRDKEWLEESDESSFAESVHSLYFHLPVEIAATEWAVRFINTNPNAIKELTRMVVPKIERFYKLNKINAD